MKLQIYNYFKTRGPPSPISYKPNQTIRTSPNDNVVSLRFEIKTQPGYKDGEMMSIYMPNFGNRSPEALLKFVTILKKTIKRHYMYTGLHKYRTNRNLFII